MTTIDQLEAFLSTIRDLAAAGHGHRYIATALNLRGIAVAYSARPRA